MVGVSVFVFLIVLRIAVVSLLLLVALNVGPECPACGKSTLRIRARWMRRVLPWLQHRWCLDCGWEGVVRKGPSRRPARTPVGVVRRDGPG